MCVCTVEVHCDKMLPCFLSPGGMSLTKLSPTRKSLVSDIPSADGKLANLFFYSVQCWFAYKASFLSRHKGLSAFHFIFVKKEEEREKLPRNYYQLPFTPHTHTQ